MVESGGKLVTERDGLDGDCGRVNILSRRGFENHGTVENNGQFTVVYDGDGNGNLDHAGTLVGLPDNCLKEAWVYSYADLKAAVENEYDEILVSENEVTVSGDLTIPKDIELYIEPSASLIVEENCTLQTDCYQIANDATITVYGTLQLGKTCKLHNFGTLEIGQLTGDAVSRVVALADGDQRAYIFNDGNIQIYGTGDLDLTNGDYAPYGWDNGIRYAKGNINDWSKVKLPAGMQRKAL